VHSGPPTSLSTHGRFRPIGPLSHPPAPTRLPCAAHRSLPSGGRLASRRRHRRHPPPLALWLTPAPKRGPRRWSWPPSRRAPRPPGASLPSTYTPRSRRYKKSPPPPMALPTLAASGDPVPYPPTRSRRRRRREEEEHRGARSSATRREAGAAREEEPDPREPRTPTTPASSASSPPRRPASPTSAASFLVTAAHTPFTDAYTSARGHPGEDAASPPLWTPRPSSRGGTIRATAPPRRFW
jgi:hypothetical protein